MDRPAKTSAALFLLTLVLSSTISPILACGHCNGHSPKHSKPPSNHHNHNQPRRPGLPVIPPVGPRLPLLPPVTGTSPPATGGTTPPGAGPCPTTPGTTPGTPPGTVASPPPPPPPATCPVDALKIGACVDLLGGLVHAVIGDPVVNQCCPILDGLLELEAAVCLCTTIRLKLLNINIYLPIALQLLITCGKTPPSGFTCTV